MFMRNRFSYERHSNLLLLHCLVFLNQNFILILQDLDSIFQFNIVRLEMLYGSVFRLKGLECLVQFGQILVGEKDQVLVSGGEIIDFFLFEFDLLLIRSMIIIILSCVSLVFQFTIGKIVLFVFFGFYQRNLMYVLI